MYKLTKCDFKMFVPGRFDKSIARALGERRPPQRHAWYFKITQ